MKRILLVCCLLTAACGFQQAHGQTTYTGTVTDTGFTAKVNLMDSYLAAGDITNAQATWTIIESMMRAELGVSKNSVAGATTAADRTTYMAKNTNQYTYYSQAWALKGDLATNRAAIHTALLNFAGTI